LIELMRLAVAIPLPWNAANLINVPVAVATGHDVTELNGGEVLEVKRWHWIRAQVWHRTASSPCLANNHTSTVWLIQFDWKGHPVHDVVTFT